MLHQNRCRFHGHGKKHHAADRNDLIDFGHRGTPEEGYFDVYEFQVFFVPKRQPGFK